MTRIVRLQPLTAAAFAPFGEVKQPPAPGARDAMEGLGANRDRTKARLGFSHPTPNTLPLRATEMERHPWSSQTFNRRVKPWRRGDPDRHTAKSGSR